MTGVMKSVKSVLVVACLASLCVAALASNSGAAGRSADRDAAKRVFIGLVPGVQTNLDPAVFQGRATTGEISVAWQATLLRSKPAKEGVALLPGPFAMQPYLAASYKREADGSYTFVLRDAKSNAGNPLTSEDIKYSFDRMLALDGIARFFFGILKINTSNMITIINSKTFRINLNKPSNLLVGSLFYYSQGIYDSVEMKKHATDADPWSRTWLSTHSASFGPYYVDSFAPGQTIFLKANPNHWKPLYYKTAVIRALPDSGTRLQLMLSGQATQATYLDWNQFKSASTSDKLTVVGGLSPITNRLNLNFLFKQFADARVRRAISMAIDRAALVRTAYAGFGKPALYQNSSTLPGVAAYAPPATYNPTQAKALLADAGYPNGFDFKLSINPALSGGEGQALAELIQAQLQQVGLRVQIETIASSAEFQAQRTGKRLQAYLVTGVPAINDALFDMVQAYNTQSKGGITNHYGYTNDRFDFLSDRLNFTEPGKVYNRLLGSALKILSNDAPAIQLVEVVNQMVFAKGVTGFNTWPPGYFYIDDLSAGS